MKIFPLVDYGSLRNMGGKCTENCDIAISVKIFPPGSVRPLGSSVRVSGSFQSVLL